MRICVLDTPCGEYLATTTIQGVKVSLLFREQESKAAAPPRAPEYLYIGGMEFFWEDFSPIIKSLLIRNDDGEILSLEALAEEMAEAIDSRAARLPPSNLH
jgi:hypothetical protein